MIKKLLLILFIVLSINKLSAQVMASKPEWVTIKTPNLRCWECKERLEKWLIVENKANMQSGLIQWKFNLLNGEIRFQYLPDRVTVDEIRIALNNAGFDADDEKAEESSYKKLPPICKRNEEGGGPQKGKPCHIESQQ